MAEKLNVIGHRLERAAEGTLLFLCICIFCGLTFYSARYTMAENGAIALNTHDSAGLNLLVLAVVTAAAILLHRILQDRHLQFMKRRLRTWKPYMVGIVSVIVYILSAAWVSVCHVAPCGDSGVLCSVAQEIMEGNYTSLEVPGCYMVVFPHQFSLLSVIHFLFTLFGSGNYLAFQHLNALCMPILFYSGYKFLQYLCEDSEVLVYYVLFFLGCIPLFLYVPFVYGEIISITFTMVFMRQTTRYCKTGKRTCCLLGTAAIVLACMVRKNSLIILAAAGIVLVVHSIRKANPRGVVWILVMVLAVSGSDRLIHTYYEKMTGIKEAGGVPYLSWIRMGLQDTWAGPGWFDNSSVEVFAENGYNTKLTVSAEKNLLTSIMADMREDKASGADFFRRKILSQWNSPGYNYMQATENFDCPPEELPALVKRIYYDDAAAFQTYMDRYQFVLYFFTAMSAIVLFADKKKRGCLAEYLLYIAIVGGFLFSALWEACSRYVLPYMAYMVPMAAVGICRLTKLSDRCRPFRRFP